MTLDALRAGFVVATILLVVPTRTAGQAPPLVRATILTATDRQGATVLDLAASELRLKEGGRDREIVKLEPATDRMQIALIVDDNGTGLFRATVAQFIDRLRSQADFSITIVTGQAMKLVDYTDDVTRLSKAVAQLGARPGSPDGGQLLGAIYEAARDFQKREAVRPVIVAMTVGGEEHTPLPAHHVLSQLRDSRASLNVFEMSNTMLRSTAAVTRASQLLEENMNIGEVLGDGSKQSGGRKDEIVAVTGVLRGALQLADELAHQYKVTYVLPPGTKPNERLEVSASRPGVVVRAPTRVSTK